MNSTPFRQYLKKSGKKEHVIDGLVQQVERFERYLAQKRSVGLEVAVPQDILDYMAVPEAEESGRARKEIRALALYYRFSGNAALADLASQQREAKIAKTRSSFLLRDFLGIDPSVVQKLRALGVTKADQMLERGSTPEQRHALAGEAGISEAQILELVKLSDLSRLAGVKAIRARLYYEAGVDTVEKLAAYEAEELLALTAEFVQRTGFDGIPPLPKEVRSTIATAREMEKIVEY